MKKSGADLLKAQAMANSLINEYNVEEAPTPILFIAHQQNFEVVSAEFEETLIISGLLDFEKHQIIVNQRESAEIRAFTIARALGHWILHQEELHEIPELRVIYQFSLGGKEKSFFDKEALCFASHLLVPDEIYKTSSHLADAALAVKFHVPEFVIALLRKEFRKKR